MGRTVLRLEEQLAAYCRVRHVIGCASGTDALLLALMALGIGPGDKVITSPFSFFATVASIARLGATPVLVDIDPRTFNISAAAVEAALQRHENVKAILPVHLFGACAEMKRLLATGVPVIEDAAQAIGAESGGESAGSMGVVGCFSLYPGKNLGAWGDAGFLTTNDDALAAMLRKLRVHGESRRYYHDHVGINSRLDAMQAAVVEVKLPFLDEWTAARQKNAADYQALFAERNLPVLVPQAMPCQTRHVWNQFTLRTEQRDGLREHLTRAAIGTQIYYPLPLHMQECFAYLGVKEGELPEAEKAAREVLSIPVYPEMKRTARERVVEEIAKYFAK
jgi:dTDP-4-amino-4,6-dideoxygalactose transaminase